MKATNSTILENYLNISIGFSYYAQFTIDKVEIYTSVLHKRLVQVIPVKKLEALNQAFYTRPFDGKGGYKSMISFSTASQEFLKLLLEYENKLGYYIIHLVEFALDFPASDEQEAYRLYDEITQLIWKKWPVRKYPIFVDGPPRPGHDDKLSGRPTFYCENKHARLGIKAYCRYSKVTGKPVFRVEFTIRRASSVRSKTGIDYLPDLLNPDPVSFIEKYLALYEINHEAFGTFLLGRKARRMDRDAIIRISHLFLRIHIYNDIDPEEDPKCVSWDEVKRRWYTVMQLKGFLLEERARCKKKVGRKNVSELKFSNLTDYRLKTFFTPATNNYITQI